MQRELDELDFHPVRLLEPRDARAREIAPGADVIAEYFEDQGLAHEVVVIITGAWSLVPNSR